MPATRFRYGSGRPATTRIAHNLRVLRPIIASPRRPPPGERRKMAVAAPAGEGGASLRSPPLAVGYSFLLL